MTEKQDEKRLKELLSVFNNKDKKELIEILNRDQIRYHKEQLRISSVSERFILVEWLNEIPLVDGSLYFDTKEDLIKHFKELPKIEGLTHTICRIRNAYKC